MEAVLSLRQLQRWGTGILLLSCILTAASTTCYAAVESDEADLLSSDEFEGGPPRSFSAGRGDDGDGREFGIGFVSGSKKGVSVRGGEKVATIAVEHDLGFGFVPAGEITARVKSSIQGGQKFAKAGVLERYRLSAEDRAAFEDLVAKDGYYRVRVPGNVLKSSKAHAMASARARCLAAASFQETFEIHVDHLGNVLGLSYKPKADCSKSYVDPPTKGEFVSTVAISHAKIAPRLMPSSSTTPGAGAAAAGVNAGKPRRADATGATGEKAPEPEKTFWQKYWLYIIAGGMLVMNIMTTLTAMPEVPADGAMRGGGGGGARRR